MLLEAKRSIFMIIDLQQRLIPAIDQGTEAVARAAIVLEGARRLGVPVIVSEQYPKGLGPTEESIAANLPNKSKVISKLTFNAMKNADFARELAVLRAEGRDQIVVCGTETHICVMQTVADLLAEDASVFLVNDAVGSRNPDNRQAGIARMANLGAHCVTSEMVLFEWLEAAGSDDFKIISKLII